VSRGAQEMARRRRLFRSLPHPLAFGGSRRRAVIFEHSPCQRTCSSSCWLCHDAHVYGMSEGCARHCTHARGCVSLCGPRSVADFISSLGRLLLCLASSCGVALCVCIAARCVHGCFPEPSACVDACGHHLGQIHRTGNAHGPLPSAQPLRRPHADSVLRARRFASRSPFAEMAL